MRRPSLSFFHSRKLFSLHSAFFSAQPKPRPPYIAYQSTEKDVRTLQNHQSQTNNSTDPLHYLKTFSTLTKTLLKNPRNFRALSNLDSMLRQTHYFDSATSVFVIDCLSQLKKLERAKTVLSNLKNKGRVSDHLLYSLVLDCLVKNGKIKDAEIVWSEIIGFESSILRFDISDYVIYVCKFGGVSEIKRICERILLGSRVLKKQSYIALIGALCRVNEGLLAKEVVLEMYDKGLNVDNLTYFVMFQCFCRNGDLDEADLILRKLVKRNYHIDICIYGNFIYALCKTGKFREANKLFHKLVKGDCFGGSKVEFLKGGKRAIFQLNCKGAVPEMMAYETYFRSLCSVGRLDEAEVLLKKMMKKITVPEICVYGSFIKALFRAGREEDVMKFFKVERKKGIVRVDEISRFIIIGLCEKGNVDDALRIFNEIVTSSGLVNCVDICNYILGGYWKVGRVADAERFFDQLRDGCFVVPNLCTYKTLVSGYCKEGNFDKALCIFEEMLNSNIAVDRTLYEMITRGLCSCGRFKDALVYLNYMIENGHFVSCVNWKVFFNSDFIGD